MGDRLARFGIAAAHAFLQRLFQTAVEGRVLPDRDEQHRHAGVLARIAVRAFRHPVVFYDLVESPCRALVVLFRARFFEQPHDVGIHFFERGVYARRQLFRNLFALIHNEIIPHAFDKVNARWYNTHIWHFVFAA